MFFLIFSHFLATFLSLGQFEAVLCRCGAASTESGGGGETKKKHNTTQPPPPQKPPAPPRPFWGEKLGKWLQTHPPPSVHSTAVTKKRLLPPQCPLKGVELRTAVQAAHFRAISSHFGAIFSHLGAFPAILRAFPAILTPFPAILRPFPAILRAISSHFKAISSHCFPF